MTGLLNRLCAYLGARPDGHRAAGGERINYTASGVAWVRPGYYLDDPACEEELRRMGEALRDYLPPREVDDE